MRYPTDPTSHGTVRCTVDQACKHCKLICVIEKQNHKTEQDPEEKKEEKGGEKEEKKKKRKEKRHQLIG